MLTDWDKTGTRLGQDRDKTGTRLGQDWDKTGTRLGQDWGKHEPYPNQPIHLHTSKRGKPRQKIRKSFCQS